MSRRFFHTLATPNSACYTANMPQVITQNLTNIPHPAEKRIALRVTPSAERALRQRHPWLFADAIQHQSHEGQPGDLAVIFNKQRKFLAIGLFDPTSPIRVRVLQHHKPTPINQAWFTDKLIIAAQLRATLPGNTNGYRLVHGENDGLPGLVIDRYDSSLVMKLYSVAWIPYLKNLVSILREMLNPKRIILRLGRGVAKQPNFLYQLEDGALIYGDPPQDPVLFLENGITFEADLRGGQKTGFFLDQRDNRSKVEKISTGKRVLNIFSYSGGFSVYAARGGAREVVSVDLSKPALEAARRNFAHNAQNAAVAACDHKTIAEDAFKLLRSFNDAGKVFDIVIIDPPSFAKNRQEIDGAMAAYQRLTRLGLAVTTADGVFVQASCSSRIDKETFFYSVRQAAQQGGRTLTEIERTGHALDHPIGFPEGEYLKCLFARV